MPFEAIEALLFPEPDELEELVVGQVASSALFASRFRENAARALLLPRRRPGTRTPLWQQRQRAADLLAVASRYGSFPILVETYREVLSDVFDLPALREVLGGVARREIAVHAWRRSRASPFASSLLFDYVAAYMYDGDAPLAERRAGALTLDRDLLRELLGQEELRELLDPEALADLELSLQALTDDRRATTADQLHDLLRRLGDLSADEIAARTEGGAVGERRLADGARRLAPRGSRPGRRRRPLDRDRGRRPLPRRGRASRRRPACPDAFLGPATAALDGLLARFARTHGPFLTPDPARRWGLPIGVVEDALERLLEAGTILRGEFRPGGSEREWIDPDVLRILRRRSLARLRREVEPVDPAVLGRFLPAWHGVAAVGEAPPALRPVAALERLAEVVDQLAGLAIPASVLERDVLPARIPGLPAAPPRRAGGDGRGGLGRAGEPRSRRRADRAVPARSRGPSAGRPRRRRRRTRRSPPRARSASTCAGGAPRSTGSCSRPPAAARIARSSMRCGISSGPGEVTNDTFAPLRALRWKRPARDARRRPGRLTSLGPPEAAGRWSLVERRARRSAATAQRRDPPPRNASTR